MKQYTSRYAGLTAALRRVDYSGTSTRRKELVIPPRRSLTGDFTAWLGSEKASFLAGRFVWANWDRDELLARQQETVDHNLYKTAVSGVETQPWR
ncbi:hypothetical protein M419DRAFT_9674 [Trichoderma reesei RUT C-30]|uniref:Uncharacterized protein n=1 Tax=Hypocrea jecorina (strain ATCC 56765 / BCRC 32924 / NRRL 11460 / Rut C-30) TaxID=1344414 RepID=A0A024S6S0_HYPJR|nr:hypothetical protein M419DRAFT_9674 [Trichoderma reesei RUT C-30]